MVFHSMSARLTTLLLAMIVLHVAYVEGQTILTSDPEMTREGDSVPTTFTVGVSSPPSGAGVLLSVSWDEVLNPGGEPQIESATPQLLRFIADNWDILRTVSVYARDDPDIEPPIHQGRIDLRVVTGPGYDPDWEGVSTSVTVDIEDNDMAGISLSTDETSVTEGGPASVYSLSLLSRPTSDVTMNVKWDADQLDSGLDINYALLVFFNFNDGTADDSSGNQRHAEIVGSVTDSSEGVSGTHAFHFTEGGHIRIPEGGDVSFLNGLAGLSISVWIYNELPEYHSHGIFRTVDGAFRKGIGLEYTTAGNAYKHRNFIRGFITLEEGAASIESASNAQVSNRWQHIVLTWQSQSAPHLWIDGQFDNDTITAFVPADVRTGESQVLRVGKGSLDRATGAGWEGLIDEFRIYDRVLAPEEIYHLYTFSPFVIDRLIIVPSTWFLPHFIHVQAVDDDYVEGTMTRAITHNVTETGDVLYASLETDSFVSVDIQDNDVADVEIGSLSHSPLVEGGSEAEFGARLTARPLSPVTLTQIPGQAGQLVALDDSLQFDSLNAFEFQDFRVMAAQDSAVEGSHTGQMTFSVESTAPGFSTLTVAPRVFPIEDDDIPSIRVERVGEPHTITEGSSTGAEFQISLETWPLETVTVQLIQDAQTTVEPGQILLDESESVGVFTVYAFDDRYVEDNHEGNVSLVVHSTEGQWSALALDDVQVEIVDDDMAGVVVTQEDIPGSVSETDTHYRSTYTVKLLNAPLVDVSVRMHPDSDLGVEPQEIRFFAGDETWDVAQDVTVRVVDDDFAKGSPHISYVFHSSEGGSSAWDFSTEEIDPFQLSILDDDRPDVDVEFVERVIEGETDPSFSVVLHSRPNVDSAVTVSASIPEGIEQLDGFDPIEVVFDSTEDNWNIPQTFQVVARDDQLIEGDHSTSVYLTVTSNDPIYEEAFPIESAPHIPFGFVELADNGDAAGITVSPGGEVTLDEAGGVTATYALSLDSQPFPGQSVVVSLSVPSGQLSIAPSVLIMQTFGEELPVTVTAVDDSVFEGGSSGPPHSGTVQHVVSGNDPHYASITIEDQVFAILDNDIASFSVTGPLDLLEGEQVYHAYEVELASVPLEPLVASMVFDEDELESSLTSVSIADTTGTLYLRPRDDQVAQGSRSSNVTFTLHSNETAWDQLQNLLTVQIDDDDEAGITVEVGGPTTIAEGSTTWYTIVLTSQPTADVTIAVSVEGDSTVDASPTTLVFIPELFDTPQSVTVTATEDDRVEGDLETTLSHTSTSTDPLYDTSAGGVSIDSVLVTVVDDDTAGVVVYVPSDPLLLSEGDLDTGATYLLRLTSDPSSSVTISMDPGTFLSVVPSSVVFDENNWDVNASVTVFSLNDDVDRGDQYDTTVAHSVTSSAPEYASGLPSVSSVSVRVLDNDAAGVTLIVLTAEASVREGENDTVSYTVSLDSSPLGSVTVAICSPGDDIVIEAPTSPYHLIYTSETWSNPQTVSLSAVDDYYVEGDETITLCHTVLSGASDSVYEDVSVDNVTLVVYDDDSVGFLVSSAIPDFVNEGGTVPATYDVQLLAMPLAAVTVTVHSGSRIQVDDPVSGAIVFLPNEWDIPQKVSLLAPDDEIAGFSDLITITHTSASADGAWDNWPVPSVNITVFESPGNYSLTYNVTAQAVEGGDPGTFEMHLATSPAFSAIVTLHLTDGGSLNPAHEYQLLSVEPSQVLYDESNWDTLVVVTVTARDDRIVEEEEENSGIVRLSTTSDDPHYDNLQQAVPIPIEDNDVAAIVVGSLTGVDTLSEGDAEARATYTLHLTAHPRVGSVTVVPSSPDAQVLTTAASVIWTSSDFDAVRTITAFANDDILKESTPHTGTLVHAVLAQDSTFSELAVDDVMFSIADDEVAGFSLGGGTTSLSEGGSPSPLSTTFTVELLSTPSSETTAVITVDGGSLLDVGGPPFGSSMELSFVVGLEAQEFTVQVQDDQVAQGRHNGSFLVELASADAAFHGVSERVIIQIDDDDEAGITVEVGGPTTIAEGSTTWYTIVLTSQPTADVTIAVSVEGDSTVDASPTTLVFIPELFDTPQSVTVTATEDDRVEGDLETTLSHTSTSTDPLYDTSAGGVSIDSVLVTVVDDDTAGVVVYVPSDPLLLSEGDLDTGAIYLLRLTSDPSSSVTISMDPGTFLSVVPSSVVFDENNWDVNASVTVFSLNDDVDRGDQYDTTVAHSVTSSAPEYASGLPSVSSVSVRVLDNDAAGVTLIVLTAEASVREGENDTVSYTVSLDSSPLGSVTVAICSPGDDIVIEAPASPYHLIYTSETWSNPQTVSLSAVDDYYVEGDETITLCHTVLSGASDSVYEDVSVDNVTLVVYDNDNAGLQVERTTGSRVSEDPSSPMAAYSVSLTAQPLDTVTVALTSSELVASPSTVIFTDESWDVSQEIRVRGYDDLVAEGEHEGILEHQMISSDVEFAIDDAKNVSFTILDNDPANIIPAFIRGATEDGQTGQFSVLLSSQPIPTTIVTINVELATGSQSQATLDVTHVVFDASNWNTAQTIEVTAVDDRIVEPHDPSVSVLLTAISGHMFQGTSTAVDISIEDNDPPTIGLAQPSPLPVLWEENPAATASYTLTLMSQPVSPVTVHLELDQVVDLGSGYVVLTTVDTGVEVTIKAVDDRVHEGTHTGSVVHTVETAPQDAAFRTAPPPSSISFSIIDDDAPGFSVTGPTPAPFSVREGEESLSLCLSLPSEPQAGTLLTVEVRVDESQVEILSPHPFVASHSVDECQTIELLAHNDTIDEPDVLLSYLSVALVSDEASWQVNKSYDLLVYDNDDNCPAVMLSDVVPAIDIQFEADVPDVTTKVVVDCQSILDPSFVANLGEDAVCIWETARSLRIVLGTPFSIEPLNRITFGSNLCTWLELDRVSPVCSCVVAVPSQLLTPTALIVALRRSVSPCDTVVLDGSYSYGGYGMPLSYTWSVVAGDSELDAFLHTEGGSVLRVGPSYLGVRSTTYTFQLTVTNILGQNDSASVDVYASSYATQSFFIDGSPDLVVHVGEDITLEGRFLGWTQCPELETEGTQPSPEPHWTYTGEFDVSQGSTHPSLPSGSVRLPLPPPNAEWHSGASYSFTLGSKNESLDVDTATVNVRVERGAIVATIAGGARRALLAQSATLDLDMDASGSYDEENPNQSLEFDWSCTFTYENVSCPLLIGNETVSLFETEDYTDAQTAPSFFIPSTLLVEGIYHFSVHVEPSVLEGTLRSAEAHQAVHVLPGVGALVSLTILPRTHSERLIVVGTVTTDPPREPESVQWSILPSGTISLSDVERVNSSSMQSALIVPVEKLIPGMSYTFRLEVMLDGQEVWGETTIAIPLLPLPGVGEVIPPTGVAGETLFEVESSGWVSSDDALWFAFGVEGPDGAFWPLIPFQSSRRREIVIPTTVLGDVSESRTVPLVILVEERQGRRLRVETQGHILLLPPTYVGSAVDYVRSNYTDRIAEAMEQGDAFRLLQLVESASYVLNTATGPLDDGDLRDEYVLNIHTVLDPDSLQDALIIEQVARTMREVLRDGSFEETTREVLAGGSFKETTWQDSLEILTAASTKTYDTGLWSKRTVTSLLDGLSVLLPSVFNATHDSFGDDGANVMDALKWLSLATTKTIFCGETDHTTEHQAETIAMMSLRAPSEDVLNRRHGTYLLNHPPNSGSILMPLAINGTCFDVVVLSMAQQVRDAEEEPCRTGSVTVVRVYDEGQTEENHFQGDEQSFTVTMEDLSSDPCEESFDVSCAFWDATEWSKEGCWRIGAEEDGLITCQCDHLSEFSAFWMFARTIPRPLTAHCEEHGEFGPIICIALVIGFGVATWISSRYDQYRFDQHSEDVWRLHNRNMFVDEAHEATKDVKRRRRESERIMLRHQSNGDVTQDWPPSVQRPDSRPVSTPAPIRQDSQPTVATPPPPPPPPSPPPPPRRGRPTSPPLDDYQVQEQRPRLAVSRTPVVRGNWERDVHNTRATSMRDQPPEPRATGNPPVFLPGLAGDSQQGVRAHEKTRPPTIDLGESRIRPLSVPSRIGTTGDGPITGRMTDRRGDMSTGTSSHAPVFAALGTVRTLSAAPDSNVVLVRRGLITWMKKVQEKGHSLISIFQFSARTDSQSRTQRMTRLLCMMFAALCTAGLLYKYDSEQDYATPETLDIGELTVRSEQDSRIAIYSSLAVFAMWGVVSLLFLKANFRKGGTDERNENEVWIQPRWPYVVLSVVCAILMGLTIWATSDFCTKHTEVWVKVAAFAVLLDWIILEPIVLLPVGIVVTFFHPGVRKEFETEDSAKALLG